MSDAPITVIFQTFQRTDYALATIAAARANLRYSDLRWYVADDGSTREHLYQVVRAIVGLDHIDLSESYDHLGLLGFHSERTSYGRNTNRAIAAAMDASPLYLPLEDDWVLQEPLDLWRYADLLMTTEDIGMVRMGYLNAGLTGKLEAIRDSLYWRLDDKEGRDRSFYAFTGHPSLRHRRYHETHGLYPEGWQPGDTENSYAAQYSAGKGADIVWPAALSVAGPFGHIGAVQSYSWNGGVPIG